MEDAFRTILRRLPFPVLEIHPDNGSEFINHHLRRFWGCLVQGIEFSRSRPFQGNDNRNVEQKNSTPEQLAIREIYPSYACFDAPTLFSILRSLEPNELTGEYYVTDVPAIIRRDGGRVEVVEAVPPEDVLSINTLEQLAEVDAILVARQGASTA